VGRPQAGEPEDRLECAHPRRPWLRWSGEPVQTLRGSGFEPPISRAVAGWQLDVPIFFTSAGLMVLGGFRIGLSVCWVERSFQLIRFNSKVSAAKPREPINPFSFFWFHLSARTFRRQQDGQVSTTIQSVGVSVRLFGFLWDETPGANPDHPFFYSMGFARGVSSSLTVNAFRFRCDLCCRDVPGERGLSKRFEVFSRQAHVMIARKAPRFVVWRHGALVTWRPNWRFPKTSLTHSGLIRFTQGYSPYVKEI
jgi:hypothetical protein